MTDLPFGDPLTPANPAAPGPRKCRRHEWVVIAFADGKQARCLRCPSIRDDVAVRRGKNNRNRGNAIERDVAARLGMKRVGQFGGPTDVGTVGDPFVASVKSGSGYFSERYWDQLKRQEAEAGQTRLLVVTDAPGPGHKRRAMVVLDMDDWLEWHGPVTP